MFPLFQSSTVCTHSLTWHSQWNISIPYCHVNICLKLSIMWGWLATSDSFLRMVVHSFSICNCTCNTPHKYSRYSRCFSAAVPYFRWDLETEDVHLEKVFYSHRFKQDPPGVLQDWQNTAFSSKIFSNGYHNDKNLCYLLRQHQHRNNNILNAMWISHS